MDRSVVQSMWIGTRLSVMEQLSIRSYLEQGHPFHLYVYGPVANIPPGTVVLPAASILPAEEIFCYQAGGYGKGSFAGFANFFRYKLLLERGGWWTDLDSVCLRPLDFPEVHVVGFERRPDGSLHAAVGLVKAPVASPLMEYCWQTCQKADRTKLVWGESGPRLMAKALQVVDTPVHILGPEAFYPIDYWQTWQLIDRRPLPAGCHAIHLWNSKWRQQRFEPDWVYPYRSIFEQLKRRYAVTSPASARRGPGWRTVLRYRLRQFKAVLCSRLAIPATATRKTSTGAMHTALHAQEAA